eukprot:CAMPEP_0117007360 /NCGR_PEP_ID=MMETSP0472-20121206/7265_1 /TAXON_ID=693140 ORGANISM="Tiarina fusus, Strain LIS" /NCGR_SAMPLE_ID=MMETSP0472 /ASSEMBLY_ACC=CAM_ASM_000603 /LENGTH=451 /DNA_ID=CAMNT_0004709101 /DNA_START=214 /DNA_END=1569 /DNA_ORIENTATION=-
MTIAFVCCRGPTGLIHGRGVSRIRPTAATRLFSAIPVPSTPDDLLKKKRKKDAKAKRSKFIGMAKAVDRGQFSVTYQPGGEDGESFAALSGLPDISTPFTVLGIESSCDDTGAAIVRSDGVILGEALASQAEIHEEWGGIVPGLAKNAHEENIDRIVDTALAKANMSLSEVDAIGVTVGPGLEICLRVGCNKARELALEHNKPFVGIHHLEAHVLMARLEQPDLEFPFLALLVSGGHCQIMKCLGVGQYSIIGGTLDDSLGEAYDKTARLLGLPVGGGGGPAVEKLALEGNSTSVPLTIPLQKRKDCDFSYAGLKTNVRRATERITMERGLELPTELSTEDKANIAASFQNIAIKHLEQRLNRAMENIEHEEIRTLAVVGGVAANMELRQRLDMLCEKRGWNMVVPPPRLCTDQGAMSAWAAVERLKLGSSDNALDQEVYARYPFAFKTKD